MRSTLPHQLLLLRFLLLQYATTDASTFPNVARWGRSRWGSSALEQSIMTIRLPRGGYEEESSSAAADTTSAATDGDRELTLDEKVHAALEKLGLQPPSESSGGSTTAATEGGDSANCVDGVCELPPPPPPFPAPNPHQEQQQLQSQTAQSPVESSPPEDPQVIADRIAQTMKIDTSMAWAALGATSTPSSDGDDNNDVRIYHERAARDMIQAELELIANVAEDSPQVHQLVGEGHDSFLARRALAFSEGKMEDARAILMADKMDEEEEAQVAAAEEEARQRQLAAERQQQKQQSEASFKTVAVDANFDPTATTGTTALAAPSTPPKPASKESVVFDATAAQIQELVLESPVPVLLDIYADWCGPCKALSPILEDMAVKSGGSLRLVKVNSDNERAVSGALEVTALPTIFAVRDGKILNMFEGMPKSEDHMKSFIMGLLIPGQEFNPPVTAHETKKYAELSSKLVKVASSASFSFSQRERLQDRVSNRLDELVKQTGDVYDAEQSAKTVRSLLSNVVKDPYNMKFRTVNLSNKVIAAKVGKYPASIALLKGVGFSGDSSSLILGKGKKMVNIAPLLVTRDAIDKWIDRMRYEVAKAARARKDEIDRKRVAVDLAAKAKAAKEEQMEEVEEEVDPNQCNLKLRLDGKKKSHDVTMQADDPLSLILSKLPGLTLGEGEESEEVQITCVAKRLVVKSTDSAAMEKTLREHKLLPTAALVVKRIGEAVGSDEASGSTTKLSERAASKRKKKGSHTMQSTGIYGKDDNLKGELIDGGGGTWYEQDVSDDEEEVAEEAAEEITNSSTEEVDDSTDEEIIEED